MSIPRRPLGKTGIDIPILSFGTASFGIEGIDEQECIETVKLAIELGINYFDTSPYYQSRKSEEVLGKALKGFQRDQFIISTKVGRYGLNDFDFSEEKVRDSLDESLRLLGVDYVDICIIHDIEFTNLDQILNITIPAVKKLRDEGKVKFIGISGLPLYIFQYILERSSDIDLILSYCHYNLIDTSLETLYSLIKHHQVGIISASPLSMGLLTQQGEPDWHPAPDVLKKTCREVAKFCEQNGEDISQLAVHFSTRPDFMTTTLVGMINRKALRDNIRALTEDVNKEVLEKVKEMFKPVKNMTWPSGLEENNKPIGVSQK